MKYHREDIEFNSHGHSCRAWLYRPQDERTTTRSCIVMAHGFALTRSAGLARYAQTFAAAGHAVLAFDYRHFGDSAGEPRQLLSIRRQLQDWASAIRCARGLPGIDPARIALWGTSFSGGHVITAAARDGRIAAVSAQGPMMDALAGMPQTVRNAGILNFLRLGMLGMLDQLRAALGMSPVYVPVVANPGKLAALASVDAKRGYDSITPPLWRNQICARFALIGATYRPILYARQVNCPTLIQVCMHDQLVSPSAAVALARRIGEQAQLHEYDCGHFDIYAGEYEHATNEQLAFFSRALAPAAVFEGTDTNADSVCQ